MKAEKPSTPTTTPTLREQLIKTYGLPATASETDISAAATKMADSVAAANALREQEEADEVVISVKTRAGLTRVQAIGVIKRQREFNEELTRQQAGRLPRLLEIIKLSPKNLQIARKMARDEFAFLDGAEWNAALEAFKQTKP